MKKSMLFICAGIFLLADPCSAHSNDAVQPVNSVIGDISYIKKYGSAPTALTDENIRISTHLEYVEQLLRQKELPGLSPELKQKRMLLLDHLHQYRQNRSFPLNYDHPGERKPCFIDKNGSICAVGYLVEKTAGRAAAEAINSKFKYSRLVDMRSEILETWIAGSGLSKEECAMIQPEYQHVFPPIVVHRNSFGVSAAGGLGIISYNSRLPDNHTLIPAASWQMGVYFKRRISKRFIAGTELAWNQVRSKENFRVAQTDESGIPNGRFTEIGIVKSAAYLSAPFVLEYRRKKLGFGLGFQFNLLLDCKASSVTRIELENGNTEILKKTEPLHLSALDYGPRASLTYQFKPRFAVDASFYYGTTNIYAEKYNPLDWNWKVRQLSVGIKYKLSKI